ncbi:MAG: hypothetical protein Kow00124_24930 [Anaerolineae bacterium]
MRESGVCPKCGSTEVYAGDQLSFWNKAGSYWANTIPITGWLNAELDNYVCGQCGYVESYIARRDRLEKIRRKWPLVSQRRGWGGSSRTRPCPGCGTAIPEDWKACPYCGQPLI